MHIDINVSFCSDFTACLDMKTLSDSEACTNETRSTCHISCQCGVRVSFEYSLKFFNSRLFLYCGGSTETLVAAPMNFFSSLR
jgi:hypothetical protein